MPTSARRRLAAAALVMLVPALGACGFGYQTDQVYQASVGVNERSGEVDVLGALVVASSKGNGTFVASLVNKDTSKSDKLVTVTSDDAQAELGSPVEVKADSLVNLADLGAVSVTGDRVDVGNFVRLRLEFESGQKTTVNVPVVSNEAPYDKVKSGGSSSTSSSSPSPSSGPSGSPSP